MNIIVHRQTTVRNKLNHKAISTEIVQQNNILESIEEIESTQQFEPVNVMICLVI